MSPSSSSPRRPECRIHFESTGWEWITRPIVLLLLAAATAIVLRRLAAWRQGRGTASAVVPARLPDLGLTLAFAGFAAWCLYETLSLPFAAAIFPQIVAGTTLGLAALLLWQSYLIPNWHLRSWWLAWWDKFGRPERAPRFGLGFPASWWVDPARERALAEARRSL